MKVLMIFDQIQAGLGGKENAGLPLGGKTMAIGSASMLEPSLKKVEAKVIGTLYCGDGFFKDNKEEVIKKICAMAKKMNPDVVICGPAFNYAGYAYMSAVLAKEITKLTGIPAVAAMSQENADTIEEFKDEVKIVKMPKKGGTGLTESLNNICQLCKKLVDKEDITEFSKKVCY